MLDVVPPETESPQSRHGRGQRHTVSKPSRAGIVEIDWRLPARLRRPVHTELERQRRKKRQREAIVQFKRRPLYPLSHESRVTPPARANVGAEHHTGDVYRSSRPHLSASVPPYAGSFLRGKPPARARTIKKQTPAPTLPTGRQVRSAPQVKQPSPVRATLAGERDVPYQWATPHPAQPNVVQVAPPRRRRFALPLHLSIWPFKTAPSEPATSKKKVQNSDSLTSLSS